MKALSPDQVNLVSARARALADPTRLRILEILSRGEQPVGKLALATGTHQSTVSKHLQLLFRADLVIRRREASTVIYALADQPLMDCLRYLSLRHLGSRHKGARGV